MSARHRPVMTRLLLAWLASCLAAAVPLLVTVVPVRIALAQAADAPPAAIGLDAFFGDFAGRTLFPMGEPANRDLRVTIRPFDVHGLTVAWETSLQKSDDGAARNATSVNFLPTARPGVFAPVYPEGSHPDLTAGESYTWARLAGRTLTVAVFTIGDNGDHIVQQYDRTLTDAGLLLEFHRFRNGVVERQIKGNLDRLPAPAGSTDSSVKPGGGSPQVGN